MHLDSMGATAKLEDVTTAGEFDAIVASCPAVVSQPPLPAASYIAKHLLDTGVHRLCKPRQPFCHLLAPRTGKADTLHPRRFHQCS